ncbi:hypothetical protein PsYK624_057880 [Phanerochaete sordida]|uniref:F-box domain-containing protein n=1 Tax=Phanerochaete sordida TaxID=48140 RepID=A0A9P3LD93_9APHY|nr:hypothetical protein PsYK624_057880 [Phanerochaete sordida]
MTSVRTLKTHSEHFPSRRTNVASLPPELLADVFKNLVAAASSAEKGSLTAVSTSPPGQLYECALVRATHVCHTWRNVAIGYQRLWTKIWPFEQHTKFLRLALERSRESTLEVYIPDNPYLGNEVVRGRTAVLQVLFKKALHRIAVLECGSRFHSSLCGHRLPVSRMELPMLRHLRIGDDLTYWLNLRCPRLESLHIMCKSTTSSTWRKFHTNVPLASLRRLTIGEGLFSSTERTPSANDVLDLLRAVPQLEALSLVIYESQADGKDVELSRLRELDVATDYNTDITHLSLLRKLIVPASTTLRIGYLTRKLRPHALELVAPMMSAFELYQWAHHLGPLRTLCIAFHDDKDDGAFSVMLGGDVLDPPPPSARIPKGDRFRTISVGSASQLRWCAEHFPLEGVTALQLIFAEYCRDGEMLDAVRQICQRLPNVSKVTVRSEHLEHEYRSKNVEIFVGEIAEGSMFPKLESR